MVLSYIGFSWTWPTYCNTNVISSKGVYRIYYFLNKKVKRCRLCPRTSFEFLKIKSLNPRFLSSFFLMCTYQQRCIFFNIYIYLFYLFIFGCIGSSGKQGLLFVAVPTGLPLLWPLSLRSSSSRAQAQQLWHVGLVAPRHVGSSQTRAWTCVPCIGRQIPNHCTTREALHRVFKKCIEIRTIGFPQFIYICV